MNNSLAIVTITIAFGLTAGAGAALAKDWSRIGIATEGAYPPYNAIDSTGELIGFEIDLAHDLCQRMQVECEIVVQDWEGIIPGLQARKYDAIMAGMSITEERKKVIAFSDPYAIPLGYLAVRKDSSLADYRSALERINLAEIEPAEQAALDDLARLLASKTVGVQASTTQVNFLEQYMPDAFEVRRYDTQPGVDLDLQAGRIDAAMAQAPYWLTLLETEHGKDFVLIGPGINGGPFGEGTGIGIRRDDRELVEMFNQAIAEAKANGVISELAVKWFGFDISQ